jgi:uncharacterized protein (TIGR03000 family)
MSRHWLLTAGVLGAAGLLLAPSPAEAAPPVRPGASGVGVQLGSSSRAPTAITFPYQPYHPHYNRYYYYYFPQAYNAWLYGTYTPYPSFLPPGPTYQYGISPATTYGYNPLPYTYPLTSTYQSFYPLGASTYRPPALPPPAATSSVSTAPTPAPNTVLLNVRVPEADAEVWIDGVKTTQRGTARQYISPPLTPGQRYSYEITARWTENGKEVSQTRKVPIQAGQNVSVDFTQPPPP